MSITTTVTNTVWDTAKIREGSLVALKVKKSFIDVRDIEESRVELNGLVAYINSQMFRAIYVHDNKTEEIWIDIQNTIQGWDSYPDVEVEVVKY